MKHMFVDTSGWATLFDTDEPFHLEARTAVESAREKGTRLVTTNYVIAELVALMTSPFRVPRPQMIEYVNSLKTSASVDIININAGLDDQAWDLLSNRTDKKWSLVDCSSFVLMKERDITDALTNDHNFEQAGFVRLLK